jgi:hypothetical protein
MTLESYPPQYSSVNDSLVWVVYDAHSTNPTTYPNYKYIATLNIGGVEVARSRQFQDPTNNRGIFDFGRDCRDYINASLLSEMGQGVFAIDVVVKFYEEYNGTIGSVLITDSTRTFFNHYNSRYNDFTILGNYANKPATSRPLNIELFSDTDKYYIPYFATSTTPFNVTINGTTTTITPTVANTIQNINIAVGATSDYTVILGVVTYQVKVICEPITTHYMVHFLSQFGGFESMSFHKVHRKKYSIERKQWQQPSYRVSSSGVVSVKSGDIMHTQKTTFGVVFNEKLTLNTDLLSDEDYKWLFQLVASPIIYVQDGTTLYPVTISATDYDVKQCLVDGLNTLTIECDFGTKFKAQFQ